MKEIEVTRHSMSAPAVNKKIGRFIGSMGQDEADGRFKDQCLQFVGHEGLGLQFYKGSCSFCPTPSSPTPSSPVTAAAKATRCQCWKPAKRSTFCGLYLVDTGWFIRTMSAFKTLSTRLVGFAFTTEQGIEI